MPAKPNLLASYTPSPREDFRKPVTLRQENIAHLQQSWLPKLEENFQPTHVWVKWNEQGIYIYTVVHDQDIFNPCRQFNEFSYTEGDVFEVFIRPKKSDGYFEIHVTPHNIVTQLKFHHLSEIQVIRKSPHPETLLLSHLFASPRIETETMIEPGRWRVFVPLPFSLFEFSGKPKKSLWNYSFCRYDYSRENLNPVLSSSSNFTQCDFHRAKEWDSLILNP